MSKHLRVVIISWVVVFSWAWLDPVLAMAETKLPISKNSNRSTVVSNVTVTAVVENIPTFVVSTTNDSTLQRSSVSSIDHTTKNAKSLSPAEPKVTEKSAVPSAISFPDRFSAVLESLISQGIYQDTLLAMSMVIIVGVSGFFISELWQRCL